MALEPIVIDLKNNTATQGGKPWPLSDALSNPLAHAAPEAEPSAPAVQEEQPPTEPLTMAFESGGQTFWARKFSAPEVLHLAFLMPLDDEGFIAPERAEQIARLASEILRLGLAKDARGTRYFGPDEDVLTFADAPENEPFCSDALFAIDAFTCILPRRPIGSGKSETASEVPKIRAPEA